MKNGIAEWNAARLPHLEAGMICSSKKNWIWTLILIVAVMIAVSGARAQGAPPVVASAAYSIPSTGLTQPGSVAVDQCGNVYVADLGKNGNLYEIPVGGGAATFISNPPGNYASGAFVASDPTNSNLYYAGQWGGNVSEIPLTGCTPNLSAATTVGNNYGSLTWWDLPKAVSVDAAGDLFVSTAGACCTNANEIAETTAGGVNQIVVPNLANPASSMAADLQLNLYYVSNGALFEVAYASSTKSYSTTLTSLAGPYNSYTFSSNLAGVTVDAAGNLYIADQGASIIYKVPYETSTSGSALNFNDMNVVRAAVNIGGPIVFDASGAMYFPPATGTQVTKMTVNSVNFGTVASGSTSQQSLEYLFNAATTFGSSSIPVNAGIFTIQSSTCTASTSYAAGSSCTQTVQYTPTMPGLNQGGLEVGGAGSTNMLDVPLSGQVKAPAINIDPGVQFTLGGGLTAPSAIALDAAGNVYIADPKANTVLEFKPGSTTGISIGTGFKSPSGVAVDGSGNVYVADTGNNQIIEVPTINGVLSNAAQLTLIGPKVVLGTYTTTTTVTSTTVAPTGCVITGTSQVCTTPGMALNGPTGITLDTYGNLLIADTGNNRVVYVPYLSGAFSTSASLPVGTDISSPLATAVDPSGNLYVVNSGSGQLLRFSPGYATASQELVADGYSNPSGLAIDASGSLFLVDQGNNRVLRIPVLSGVLDLNNSTEVGLSVAAPYGVALDASGNLYLTDSTNKAAYTIARTGSTQNFGALAVSATSGDLPFNISNSGNASLVFASPYTTISGDSGDFSILSSGNACSSGATIAVGDSCQLAATFTPTAAGVRSETVALNSDAVNGAPQVGFGGTGAANTSTTSTLAITAPTSAPFFGEPIAASVTVAASSGGTTPTGTATLLVDGVEVSTVNLSGGIASFNLASGLPGGNHSMQAVYEAGSGFDGSNSNVLSLQVAQAPTTTTETLTTPYAAPLGVPVGKSITVTATIASPGVGIPTGTVTFTLTPASGTPITGTGAVLPAAGGVFQASFTTSSKPTDPTAMVVPAGSLTNAYAVSESYSGDTNYKPSVSATNTVIATVVNDVVTYTMLLDNTTNVLYPMDGFTNLTITQTLGGQAVISSTPAIAIGETVVEYVTALNQSFTTAGFTNVAASLTPAGVLTIEGPGITVTTSTIVTDISGSTVTLSPTAGTGTFSYTVTANSLTHAPDFVDPWTTNLTVTQGAATIVAPKITQNETFTSYTSDLNTAFTNASFTNVVAAFTGTPTTITSTVAFSYAFPSNGSVDPSTSLTVAQGSKTSVAPTIATDETVAAYVTDLNTAFTTAGFTNVVAAVDSTTGVLTITGSGITLAGIVENTGSTTPIDPTVVFSYAFPANDIVDTSTNMQVSEASVSSVAPAIAENETVAAYVTALNAAFTNAGFSKVVAAVDSKTGVLTITGSDFTVKGSVAYVPAEPWLLTITGSGISLTGNVAEMTGKSYTISSSSSSVNGTAAVIAPSSLSLTAGSSSTSITFTATTTGGWNGIVSFYCDPATLPANAQCVWTPAQFTLTPSTATSVYPVLTTTLTVVANHDSSPVLSSGFAGWMAGLSCLALFLMRKRMKTVITRLGMIVAILGLGVAVIAGLSACNSISGPVTPTGSSQVKVLVNLQPFETGTTTNYPCTSQTASPCSQQTFTVNLTVK